MAALKHRHKTKKMKERAKAQGKPQAKVAK